MMKKIPLDAADIRLLFAHGPLSKSRLAEMVGFSSTHCWARLARMKQAGFIRGYHADLALDRLVDVCKVIVTVSLKSHRKSDFDRFEKHIDRCHEVVDCVRPAAEWIMS